jgi:site-specific recombinase XerC
MPQFQLLTSRISEGCETNVKRHAFASANQNDVDLRRTGNLRAVQLLLGHGKFESTMRYLGIEIDDAIEIAEKIDI